MWNLPENRKNESELERCAGKPGLGEGQEALICSVCYTFRSVSTPTMAGFKLPASSQNSSIFNNRLSRLLLTDSSTPGRRDWPGASRNEY